MQKHQKTSITCSRVDNCSLTLVLDKRTNKQTDKYPMAICFTIKRQRHYYKLLDMPLQTVSYFNEVCTVTSSRSALMQINKEWQEILYTYRDKIVRLHAQQTLSIELIKAFFTGVEYSADASTSFLGVWEAIIARKREMGRIGTAQNYGCARNSFLKLVGEIKGFNIDLAVMKRWDEAMKTGKIIDGTLEGKISSNTRGIYLRACRVVWNECIKLGYIPKEKYPFSSTDKNLIIIPKSGHRQQSYLNVSEMTQLYNVFMEKRYPDTWAPDYTEKVHESLGLFLVQYLCNGFNFADAARLRYGRTYFAEGGRAFEFVRQKTEESSGGNAVVVVPITEALRNVLSEIAAEPKKNAFVFPQIYKGEEDLEKHRKLNQQWNANIKNRVRAVCREVLGWSKDVSGTWARHSFATNLKLAGVEETYISESMGHSEANSVTKGYQGRYPLEIRFRYNQLLLNTPTADNATDIDNMSEDQLRATMKLLMARSGMNVVSL